MYLAEFRSDDKSSVQLTFYKHMHIYIFIKQLCLPSDVKNALFYGQPPPILFHQDVSFSFGIFSINYTVFLLYLSYQSSGSSLASKFTTSGGKEKTDE